MAKYCAGFYHPVRDTYVRPEIILEVLRMLDRCSPRLMVRDDLCWIEWN